MLEQLIGLKFPAYKSQIMDFLKKNSANHEMISLFETLNGNVVYRAQYRVKKAIKQKNNSQATQENQITDERRTNLEVEKVNPAHKREEYPQVLQPPQRNTFVIGVENHIKPEMI